MMKNKININQYPLRVNNGFWDKSPEERSEKMDAACKKHCVKSFWDLSPEDRGEIYDGENGN